MIHIRRRDDFSKIWYWYSHKTINNTNINFFCKFQKNILIFILITRIDLPSVILNLYSNTYLVSSKNLLKVINKYIQERTKSVFHTLSIRNIQIMRRKNSIYSLMSDNVPKALWASWIFVFLSYTKTFTFFSNNFSFSIHIRPCSSIVNGNFLRLSFWIPFLC